MVSFRNPFRLYVPAYVESLRTYVASPDRVLCNLDTTSLVAKPSPRLPLNLCTIPHTAHCASLPFHLNAYHCMQNAIHPESPS
jgi:hypothetical protein